MYLVIPLTAPIKLWFIGIKEGAKLEYGGKRLQRPGYFLEPTIFSHVEDHMFIAVEESFGPIMVISKFSNGYEMLSLTDWRTL